MNPILDLQLPLAGDRSWLPELILAATFLAALPLALPRGRRVGMLARAVGGLGLAAALGAAVLPALRGAPVADPLRTFGQAVVLVAALAAWAGGGVTWPPGGAVRWPGRCGPFVILLAGLLGLLVGAVDIATAAVGLLGSALAIGLVLGTGAPDGEGRSAAVRPARTVAVGAATAVYGLTWLVALSGATDLADIQAGLLTVLPERWPVAVAAVLLLAGLGALALPAAVARIGAPAALRGFLATAPPAVAVLVLARVLAAVTGAGDDMAAVVLRRLLPWTGLVSAAGIAVAVAFLVAVRQRPVLEGLAWAAVGQVGLALLALGAGTPAGLAAMVLHLGAVAVAGPGVFLAAGMLAAGDAATDRPDLTGRGRRRPLLAVPWLLMLLALAGVPLLAGFPARVQALAALAATERLAWAAGGLLLAVAGLVAYVRLAVVPFRTPSATTADVTRPGGRSVAAAVVMAALSILAVAGGWLWATAAGLAAHVAAALGG